MGLITNGDIIRAKERRVSYKYVKEDIMRRATQKSKEEIYNEKVNKLKNKSITKGQLIKIIELSEQLNPDKIHIDNSVNNAYDATQIINKFKCNSTVNKKYNKEIICEILLKEFDRIGSTKLKDYDKFRSETSPCSTTILHTTCMKWSEILIYLGLEVPLIKPNSLSKAIEQYINDQLQEDGSCDFILKEVANKFGCTYQNVGKVLREKYKYNKKYYVFNENGHVRILLK